MNMYCHRCGNSLTPESLFCNRCGAKSQSQGGQGRYVASPPRPARRAPVIPSPEEESYDYYEDEYEGDYPDHGADYRQGPADKDHVIFSITPAFFEVLPSYLLAATLSLIVTAVVAYMDGPLLIALIGVAICFLRPIFRHWSLKHTIYTLTATKLEIQSGILSKEAMSIPLRHIDNVEVSETLRERLIGIGDVLIDSAALDRKMVLNNIKNPRKYADMIMDQLQSWN
jgi:membrane protein YdbS with pleckstrin-like domain